METPTTCTGGALTGESARTEWCLPKAKNANLKIGVPGYEATVLPEEYYTTGANFYQEKNGAGIHDT